MEFKILFSLVLDGIELTYGKLSLCNLEHYCKFRCSRKWQVHSEDRRYLYSEIYNELTPALNKFLEIKKKIGSKIRC